MEMSMVLGTARGNRYEADMAAAAMAAAEEARASRVEALGGEFCLFFTHIHAHTHRERDFPCLYIVRAYDSYIYMVYPTRA